MDGHTTTKFYERWKNMVRRCGDKKHPNYFRYGGRGISVCDEWLKYDKFEDDMFDDYAYHLEKHSSRQTTLERINNNLGYFKENCKWATFKEQNNNRRRRSP